MKQLVSVLDPKKKSRINACVANGGWVLKDLGSDPNNPKPNQWDTPISLPYPQPSHEPRPPPQTSNPKSQIPNQAPITLNSTFNGETIEKKPLPPPIGRGGRGKTRKHTNATTPNAEPSQSHEAMHRRTSNTQRSCWPLELPENALGKDPTAQQNTRATKRFRHPPATNPNANSTPRVNLVSKGYINSNVAYCWGGYGSSQVFFGKKGKSEYQKKNAKEES